LVEGRDFELKIGNAQGDMATLSSVVDSALADGADLLITMYTPTLQVALRRAQSVPVVFTYVSSAMAAGAARSLEDHAPNVTGIEMMGAYDQVFALLREFLPSARRVGTLFTPAEVNMVINKEKMVIEGQKAGIEVVPVAVNSSAEVSDAALAMLSRDIDAVCQIAGNLTAASFGGIAQAARRAKLPVFAFQKSQALGGAAVTLARDYHDAGREAALMAVRIMRGESPARIPIQSFTKTTLMINRSAARSVGMNIPPSVMQQNPVIVGENGAAAAGKL
jgi:putative ABC transport system substrate-binding protein